MIRISKLAMIKGECCFATKDTGRPIGQNLCVCRFSLKTFNNQLFTFSKQLCVSLYPKIDRIDYSIKALFDTISSKYCNKVNTDLGRVLGSDLGLTFVLLQDPFVLLLKLDQTILEVPHLLRYQLQYEIGQFSGIQNDERIVARTAQKPRQLIELSLLF